MWTCLYSAAACLTLDIRAESVHGAACRAVRPCFLVFFLRPLVSGSYLFGAGLPEEYIYAVYSGKRLPEMPYSALLGSTVIHVISSLRRLLFQFPLLRAYSDPAFDSRPALRLFSVCRGEYRKFVFFGAALVSTTAVVCSGLVLLVSTHFALCSLLLFPCTAQCLVLSGTCYASVYGEVEFHVFPREYVDYGSWSRFLTLRTRREGVHSAPEVDSRAALLWPWRSHRCGSWLCYWHARYCACQGRRHSFRGAAAVSLGPLEQTTEIPQLQSIEDVFDVSLVQVQQIPGAVCEKTVAIPQLQFVFFPGLGRSQLVVVQRQCRLVQTSENCAGPQFRFERGRCPLLCRCSSCGYGRPCGPCRDVGLRQLKLVGPCAQAQGQGWPPAIMAGKGWRGPRESDSQVTCHPI